MSALAEGPLPRMAPCPTCGARPPITCRTPAGYPARTHAARWAAVDVLRPNHDDLHRDYLHGLVVLHARRLQNGQRNPGMPSPAEWALFWQNVFAALRGKEDLMGYLAPDPDVDAMRGLAKRMTQVEAVYV